MIEWQARPCMNLLGMYRWFSVVPQGFVALFAGFLGGDFRSPLLVVFLVCFWDLALGDLMGGNLCEPFMVLLPLIPLPNP
jgi:hypothetical protein